MQDGVEMEERVMVGKGELGGEMIRHGRGIGDAGWDKDGRESDGRETGCGGGRVRRIG